MEVDIKIMCTRKYKLVVNLFTNNSILNSLSDYFCFIIDFLPWKLMECSFVFLEEIWTCFLCPQW